MNKAKFWGLSVCSRGIELTWCENLCKRRLETHLKQKRPLIENWKLWSILSFSHLISANLANSMGKVGYESLSGKRNFLEACKKKIEKERLHYTPKLIESIGGLENFPERASFNLPKWILSGLGKFKMIENQYRVMLKSKLQMFTLSLNSIVYSI